jgi:hypothetical protein
MSTLAPEGIKVAARAAIALLAGTLRSIRSSDVISDLT